MAHYSPIFKEGDRVLFRPTLQGKQWTDHEMYGKVCRIIDPTPAVYPVYHIETLDRRDSWWAVEQELTKT